MTSSTLKMNINLKNENILVRQQKKIIIGTSAVLLLSGFSYLLHIAIKQRKQRAEYAYHYHLDDKCLLYLDDFKSSKTKSITRKMLRYIITNEIVQSEDLDNELRIPLFKENIKHIIQQIKKAKQSKRILLFESPPGFGVRYSILNWCLNDHKQNNIILYLDLFDYFSLVFQNQNQCYSQEKEQFIYALLNVFGYFSPDDYSNKHIKIGSSSSTSSISTPCLSEESYSNISLSDKLEEKLEEIEKVLKIIKSKGKPVTLIIRNINLLFNDSENNQSHYTMIDEIFEWLLKNEKEGLLEVILFNSSSSVISIIKKFKNYEDNLDFKTYEYHNQKIVQEYLIEQVNLDLIEKYKFNKESASKFVKYFSSNFNEIEDYCQSNITVEKLISIRREEYIAKVNRFFKSTPGFDPTAALADPYSIQPIEHLKDYILEMMMKDGRLSVKYILPSQNGQNISYHEQTLKYELVMKLIKNNIFKWQSIVKKPTNQINSLLTSSKMAILNFTSSVTKSNANSVENPNDNASLSNISTINTNKIEKEIVNTKNDNNEVNYMDNSNNNYQNDDLYRTNYYHEINNENYFSELLNKDTNNDMSDFTSQTITHSNEWKDYVANEFRNNNYIPTFKVESNIHHEDIWVDAKKEKETKQETDANDKSMNYEITFYNLFIQEYLENWFNNTM